MSDTKIDTYKITGEHDVKLLARVVGFLARYDIFPLHFESKLSSQAGRPVLQMTLQVVQSDFDRECIAVQLRNIIGILSVETECKPPVQRNGQIYLPRALKTSDNARATEPPQPDRFFQIGGACGLYAVHALTKASERDIIRSFELAASGAVDWNKGFSMSVSAGAISKITGQPWIVDSGACQYSPPREQSMTLEEFLVNFQLARFGQCLLRIETQRGGHIVAVIGSEVIDNAYPGLVRPIDRVGPCVRPVEIAHS